MEISHGLLQAQLKHEQDKTFNLREALEASNLEVEQLESKNAALKHQTIHLARDRDQLRNGAEAQRLIFESTIRKLESLLEKQAGENDAAIKQRDGDLEKLRL